MPATTWTDEQAGAATMLPAARTAIEKRQFTRLQRILRDDGWRGATMPRWDVNGPEHPPYCDLTAILWAVASPDPGVTHTITYDDHEIVFDCSPEGEMDVYVDGFRTTFDWASIARMLDQWPGAVAEEARRVSGLEVTSGRKA